MFPHRKEPVNNNSFSAVSYCLIETSISASGWNPERPELILSRESLKFDFLKHFSKKRQNSKD